MTKTEKELEMYKEIFSKLKPFVVLAINDYYTGEDTQNIKQQLKQLGYELP